MGSLCGGASIEYTYVTARNIKIPLSNSEKRIIDWENNLEFQHIYFD